MNIREDATNKTYLRVLSFPLNNFRYLHIFLESPIAPSIPNHLNYMPSRRPLKPASPSYPNCHTGLLSASLKKPPEGLIYKNHKNTLVIVF